MKKNAVILVIFSFFLISSIQAEIRLGLKAGVNLASTSFNKDIIKSSNFTGLQLGPIVEFDLPVVGIKFDAAVLYSQHGLKLDSKDFEKKESALDVPVNLKFKFGLGDNLGGFLTAGPYASFRLSGEDFSVDIDNIKHDFKNKSFGAGVNLGGGIELFDHLQIGVNYRISMTDNYKTLDTSALDLKGKHRVWSVTAAYFF